MSQKFHWISRGDIDGFFGLFIDNLLALMLIAILGPYACGLPASFITSRILPGAALSVLAGNLFYSWQAHQLALATGRRNVTALPFGINTVSLLAFIFLVMAPVYNETNDADLAWKVGLSACFLSGVIETLGAFVGDWVKRRTPRAALLSGLAGVALSFIVLSFTIQIFSSPLVALLPAFLILIVYGAQLKLPWRLPGGIVAIVIGVSVAWILKIFHLAQFTISHEPMTIGFHLPKPAIAELFSILTSAQGWKYLSVVIPIALFNVIGSLENLESAEAAGDTFKTKPSLLVNGATTILAAFLGSPFPTTIYLGHPGWKAMGARHGYSALNGVVVMFLCLIGGMTVLSRLIPLEATLGILVWVGIVIVSQAFVDSDRRHAVAVVLGLVPALAAWVLQIIETTLRVAGTNLYDMFDRFQGELYIHGILSLHQGFLLSGILLSSIVANAIDREFLTAAVWSFVAAAFASLGIIHAYHLTSTGIQGALSLFASPEFSISYFALGVALILFRPLSRGERHF